MRSSVAWQWALALGFVASLSSAQAAVVHDAGLDWRSLHGAHFVVHYHDGEETQARQVLAIAERVHTRLSPVFRWQPAAPTEIVLSDEYDVSNGLATPFPSDRITLWLAPPDELNGIEDNAGWLETVIQHEYTHILHLDKARGFPRVLRSIVGRAPLLFPNPFPNVMQPTWLIEGLAVYYETDEKRGIGRGQSALQDMYMRSEVVGGMKPLRQVNQSVDTWPGGVVPYLYGSQFFDYLGERYGTAKVQQWVENYSDRVIPFRLSGNSRKTLGQPLDRVWDDFAQNRTAFYGAQLADIGARGEVAGERLSRHGYAASQTRALGDDVVYYTAFDGRTPPALMVLYPGQDAPQRLTDLHYGARIDVHPRAGVLVAQPELCDNARFVYDLYRVGKQGGSVERLTHCARYRNAVWAPDGERIAGVHHALGRSRLDVLGADGKFIETLWEAPRNDVTGDEIIGDLDWSPDGASLVAAVWRRTSGWNIELFSLAGRSWRALTRDSAIDMQPRFARDGKSVLFSSDHGGVYNLRRIDLDSGRVVTLTNVTGGAFYPAEDGAGRIYYIGYHAQGFDLYRVQAVELPTPTAAPGASGVAEATPASVNATVQDYSPWSSLRPTWWWPHIAVENDRSEWGVITSGADVLYRHQYAIDAAYDFKVRSAVGSVDYLYDRWFPILKLHASRFNEFTRDSDDELLRVRRVDSAQAEVVLPWLAVESRLSLHAGAASVRERDIESAPGMTEKPNATDALVGVAAIWDSTRRFPLSVSRSHGREVRFVAEDSGVADSDYSGRVYTVDWREFMALGAEHVLALHWVQGWSTGIPRPFRLGGADGVGEAPGVLSGATFDSPFNVREYPLRGYATGHRTLEGSHMQLATIEWRFPIARIERGFMAPPVALHQLSGALFFDSGAAWNEGGSPNDRRNGVGVELSADAAVLYSLRFNLRLGIAHGFDDEGGNQGYLRVGSSF